MPSAAQAALAFARRLDKLPLPCRSAPGFLVNRVLMPYLHEAMYAAQEGVPLAVIDEAAVDFGMPMGPIELADVVGLDVASHVGEIIAAELGRAAPTCAQLDALVAAKKLGRKSGAGFYTWQDGKAVKPPAGAATAPRRSHRSPDPGAGQRMRRRLREGVVERRGPRRCRRDLRHRLCAVPRRPARLCAQPRSGRQWLHASRELAARYGSRFRPDAGWKQLQTAGKA